MTATSSWFTVDKEGLAKLLERKGKEFVLYELIQNSWDTEAKNVFVCLSPSADVRGYAVVEATDDHPEGWKDLTHAWTLYAESEKKGNAEKRGRFNLGEKLVLALCREARIETTKGGVMFNEEGRHTLRSKRETGSKFTALVKMTLPEQEAAALAVMKLLCPMGIRTTFNGKVIDPRVPLRTIEATLPTEVADQEGVLRRSARKTRVEVYEARAGEVPSVYEMGIPVVETEDKYHYNVCVAPDTKILKHDLTYVPALSLNIGDELVGFDEERGDTDRRFFRKSVVTRIEKIIRPSYRLTFDDGTTVVCSEDHQWFTARGKSRKWMSAGAMVIQNKNKPGTRVIKLFDTWSTDTSYLAGYLAAAFDGEGSLFHSKVKNPDGHRTDLMFSQCDNPMFDRVRAFLEQDGVPFRCGRVIHERKEQRPNNRLHVSFRREIVKFLGKYRPVRLLPKFNAEMLGAINTKDSVRLIKKEFLGETPVVAIETTTHTFVAEGLASHNCQKVPLNSDRDNVTPAYLRELRTLVLNEMYKEIKPEEVTEPWVRDAASDDKVSQAAVETVMTLRYGEKRVIADPSDQEGTKLAMSQGYTVIPPRSLSSDEWANVRKFQAALPAGQVTPSPKPFGPEGEQLQYLPEEKWTEGMKAVVSYVKEIAQELIGSEIAVRIASKVTWPYAATYGGCQLTFNLGRLGHAWFNQGPGTDVDELLIHELGHHYSPDHLSGSYHDALCSLGARLAYLVLRKPELFRKHGRGKAGTLQ